MEVRPCFIYKVNVTECNRVRGCYILYLCFYSSFSNAIRS
nr:MAG TPA: hypothetical protein [Caudoviricetes sp.]